MYQWYLHWYHWKEECLLFHFIIVKNPFHNYPGFVLQAKSAIFTAKCPARAYLLLPLLSEFLSCELIVI